MHHFQTNKEILEIGSQLLSFVTQEKKRIDELQQTQDLEEPDKPISLDVWFHVNIFLRNFLVAFYQKNAISLSLPVLSSIDGSISLQWRTERYDLLIVINELGWVTYTGDDYSIDRIKGHSLIRKAQEILISWLSFFYDIKGLSHHV